MKLQTQVPLSKADNQIDYQSELLLLGSCFVENIGNKLDYFKFKVLQNPFGILFHPCAIENLISKAIQRENYTEEDIFFLNERWHCFDAHSDLSATSKEVLLQELNDATLRMHQQIKKSSHIILTLGTAWAYRHSVTNKTVANCHKVLQKEFSKELLSVDVIVKSLERTVSQIRAINKKARLVFTVSPVRHLKDGFVENQQSKAHLIAAIHKMINASDLETRISYFEAYELMMDELRDYRFYETDMVHPNQLAIDYVWEKFKYVWVSEKIHSVMDEIETIQKGLNHKPFNCNSDQHQYFLKSLNKKIANLQQQYPFMEFLS